MLPHSLICGSTVRPAEPDQRSSLVPVLYTEGTARERELGTHNMPGGDASRPASHSRPCGNPQTCIREKMAGCCRLCWAVSAQVCESLGPRDIARIPADPLTGWGSWVCCSSQSHGAHVSAGGVRPLPPGMSSSVESQGLCGHVGQSPPSRSDSSAHHLSTLSSS